MPYYRVQEVHSKQKYNILILEIEFIYLIFVYSLLRIILIYEFKRLSAIA
jgi:hypothetical protein